MIAPYYFPHIGGVEKHIERVSMSLKNKGHDICVFTIKHDNNLSDFEVKDDIKIYRLKKTNIPKTSKIILTKWILKNYSWLKNIDIIHFHDVYFSPFSILKKPLFVTFHGFEGYPILEKNIKSRKKLENLTLGNICVGDFIPKWYKTNPDIVTYGGVDLEKCPSEKEKYDIFISARLEKDTGILDYIKAIAVLNNKNLKVVLCGDGSLKKLIEKFIKENNINVKILGFVKNPDKYLCQSHYAFVSGYLSILEAMVRKKLIFSIYDNPLKKDYLEMMPESDKKMIISGSAHEFAKKFSEITENSEKEKEIISKSFSWAKNQSWDNLAEKYLLLYKQKGININ